MAKTKKANCPECGGKGRLDNPGDYLGTETCPTCAGTGRAAVFTSDEIARQLDKTRTDATLPAGPLGDWLLKQRLVRKNPRTGWFDMTPAGRGELERLRKVQ